LSEALVVGVYPDGRLQVLTPTMEETDLFRASGLCQAASIAVLDTAMDDDRD
jgi:hypothetical protein